MNDKDNTINELNSQLNTLKETNNKLTEYNNNIKLELDKNVNTMQNLKIDYDKDIKNKDVLLTERKMQIESLVKTIDVLKPLSDSMKESMNSNYDSIYERSRIFEELDKDKLVSLLYSFSAEICALSRIEGNYERKITHLTFEMDRYKSFYLKYYNLYESLLSKYDKLAIDYNVKLDELNITTNKIIDERNISGKHLNKLKELSILLDKITRENKNLIDELNMYKDNVKNDILNKSNKLENEFKLYKQAIEEYLNNQIQDTHN